MNYPARLAQELGKKDPIDPRDGITQAGFRNDSDF
jgi:hypothetical protein